MLTFNITLSNFGPFLILVIKVLSDIKEEHNVAEEY